MGEMEPKPGLMERVRVQVRGVLVAQLMAPSRGRT